MSFVVTDATIAALISERKLLPDDWRERLALKEKRGHKERDLGITGEDGNEFRLLLRQSTFNRLDFSAILGHLPRGAGQIVRLRRYNGKSHWHTNAIEGDRFYGFHIHYATERYQERGLPAEGFAIRTDRYSELATALDCLFADCGFDAPGGFPPTLF